MGNIENISKQGEYLKVPSKKRWYLVERDIYEDGNWSNKERKNGLEWYIGYLYGIIGYKNTKIVNIKIELSETEEDILSSGEASRLDDTILILGDTIGTLVSARCKLTRLLKGGHYDQ